MCGRFTLRTSGAALAEQFQLAEVPDLAPHYNIAPTQEVAVIRATAAGRKLDFLRWGLIPAWAKDPSIGARMINARAETVAEKPAFRTAFKQRRCLVIADGFYEWQGTGKQKQPFYFQVDGGQAFAFAGLWETWKNPEGQLVETCTVLTTEANELVRPVHERMPVILPADAYAPWLDPQLHDVGALQQLLRAYPPQEMNAYPVGTRVNRVTHDDAACIAPVAAVG